MGGIKMLGLRKYRYEGTLYGAGIAYGHQWILGKRWNLEATIGVGYARIEYDKYEYQTCGPYIKKGTKRLYRPHESRDQFYIYYKISKVMKRAFIYTIFLLTVGLFFTELKAQEVYLGEVKIIQNRFEQRGDSVYIEMNVNLNGLPVHKNQSFILTPVVETEKASEELPSIVINGKRREKSLSTVIGFQSRATPFPIYTTVIVNQWSRERIAYNVVVPYETWMKDAKLNLRENFCECGGEKRLISIKMLAQTIKLETKRKQP